MGVDENGLGPRLGPLTATGVVLGVTDYRRASWMRKGLALGIDDSKQASGFGRMALCESVSLALMEHACGRVPTTTDDALAVATGLPPSTLQEGCPDASTKAQCWSNNQALPVFGGDLDNGRDRLRQLIGRSRLQFKWVRSAIACVGALNRRGAKGENKLSVDLRLFEELMLGARQACDGPLLAVCGMVGGIRDYPSHFKHFEAVEPLQHRRGQRRYAVSGVGEVRFEVSADARHLPVALASMLGKYLRELSMHRISDFYRQHDPALQAASGYHDPVTTRFMAGAEPTRVRLNIANNCFERRA